MQKKKALIAKMIREVKEVDYKESIRQEKRLMEQIAKLDKKLIDASKIISLFQVNVFVLLKS